MLPYLEGWHDVEADGNCGFRCVADDFHGGEANLKLARHSIRKEILSNLTYSFVYFDGVSEVARRINWGGGPCGEDHYMEIICDLFPIVNLYKCAVMCYRLGNDGTSMYPSVTVLP